MQFSFQNLNAVKVDLNKVVVFVLIIFVFFFFLALVAAFGVYYFNTYQAVHGEPESVFQPKDFSSADLKKAIELLDLRAERFNAASTSLPFVRAFR
jgi:hypothetical protein